MPTALPDIIFQDAATSTGNGLAIGFGEGMRYVNASNKHQVPVKFKVRAQLKDTGTGATATVIVEDSNDNSTYATLYTFSFTVPATAPYSQTKDFGFSTKKRYIRARISAIAGGSAPTVNAYCTLGSWGQ